MKTINYRSLSVLLAASLSLYTSAHADYNWNGAVSSDPTVSGNYTTSPLPTYGTSNSGNLSIANSSSQSPLGYSATQGSTVFNGNIRVGVDNNNNAVFSSELDVNGGNLTINSGGTSTVGYRGSGTIGVSGGTFSVNGSDQFWFGNENAATANVSGGTFFVGDSFLFSRDGGTSTINLSGNGVFNVTGVNGTQYGAGNTGGVATINLNGNGVFEQTGSNSINLISNFNINFGSGSLGQFSLLGDNTSTLNSLITSGHFQINGTSDTTLSDYNVIGAANSSSQGVIELASAVVVPEPSTWALMLGGLSLLIVVQRKRFFKA